MKKLPLILISFLCFAQVTLGQIADPTVTDIQIAPNNNCLGSTETAIISITNLGANLDLSINPLVITLNVNGSSGSQIYNDTLNTGLLLNTVTNFVFVNNINLYDAGCYHLNTTLLSTGGNSDVSNDSLSTAQVVCNARPQGVDYHLCLGDSIPTGQGLGIISCPTVYVKDSIVIPFTLNFVGNLPPNPTQCAATGAGAFASATLPYLPLNSNILSGELSVTNLSSTSFNPTPILTRFSLYQGPLPTTPPNIFHGGVSGYSGTTLGCFNNVSTPSIADLNSIFSNGVPINPFVNLGHWSTNRCTTSSIYANCGSPTVASLKIVYEYIESGTAWFEQPSGGISISNASAFDPLKTPNTLITNNNTLGTYTFYGACASDTNCRVASNLTVTGLNFSNVAISDVLCHGGTDGTISVQVAGGSPPYNYILQAGPSIVSQTTSGLFSGLAAGSYTLYVTDASGCSTPDSLVTISEPLPLQITNVSSTTPTCVPGCDATMTIMASGGTPFYSYNIGTNNQVSNVFTNVCAGAHTVSVVDANGCYTSSTATVQTPGAPTFSSVTSTPAHCGQADGSISVTVVGGVGPISYSISGLGSNSTGQYNNVPPGIYNVVVTDANGCSIQTLVTVSEPPIYKIDSVRISTSCNTNGDSIILHQSGGTLPYHIVHPAPSINTPHYYSLTTSIITNAVLGTYNIVVSDANGCTASTSFNMPYRRSLQIDSLSLIPPSTCTASDGTIKVQASGTSFPVTYAIPPFGTAHSNLTGIFNGLSSGTYQIKASSGSCYIDTTFDLTLPGSVSIDTVYATKNLCFGDSTGTLTAIASGAATFSIIPNNGIQTAPGYFTNLPSDTYTIYATGSNNCSVSTSIWVPTPSQMVAYMSTQDVRCYGDSTGFVWFSTSGGTYPATLTVSPNLGTPPGFNIPAGTYTVNITDANGCEVSDTVTISEPPLLSLDVFREHSGCLPTNSGYIRNTAIGGTSPYTYFMNNVQQSGARFDNLSPGVYDIKIKDANGCEDTATVEVKENYLQFDSIQTIPKSCLYSKNAKIIVHYSQLEKRDVEVITCQSPFAFKSDTVSNLDSGWCQVYILDPHTNCEDTMTVYIPFIPEDAQLDSYQVTQNSCAENKDGMITYSSIKQPPFNYEIEPKNGWQKESGIFSDLSIGKYIITGEDGKGCIGKDTIIVDALDDREFIYSSSKSSNVHCYGTINAQAVGGIGDYTYSLQPKQGIEISSGSYDGLCWGNYTLQATDSTGCIISTKIRIEEDLNAPRNMFHHFAVYPNPANDKLWLRSNYLFEYEVSLVNLTGQTLMKKNCYAKLVNLDVSNLAPGLYILRFNSDVDHFERKVLIQH